MSNVSEMSPVNRIKAWLNDEIELTDEEVDQAIDGMSASEAEEWLGRCIVFLVTGSLNALK